MQRMLEFSFVFADGKTFRIAVGEPIKLNKGTIYWVTKIERCTVTDCDVEGVVEEIQYDDGVWYVKLEGQKREYVFTIKTFQDRLTPTVKEVV